MPCYYWDAEEGEVKVTKHSTDVPAGACVVDTQFKAPYLRYGVSHLDEFGKVSWVYHSFDSFPAEFKLALLVLGVI